MSAQVARRCAELITKLSAAPQAALVSALEQISASDLERVVAVLGRVVFKAGTGEFYETQEPEMG